jgi:hypothetical protein
MVIHPRDHDLIVGTHGRSIYVIPLEPIRKITELKDENKFHVFKPEKVRFSKRWGEKRFPYLKAYIPEARIMYFVSDENAKIEFEVYKDDVKCFEKSFNSAYKGFNDFSWDLLIHPIKDNNKPNTKELTYAGKGKYTLKFTGLGETREVEFEIQ